MRISGPGVNPDEFGYVYDPVNSAQQIYPAVPGGGVAMASSGFAPKMQVKLHENGILGATYVVNLRWSSFGFTAFRVPLGAAQGPHTVRSYRFYMGTMNGTPVYGPWLDIPPAGRPIVLVQ
jgi:hypothetical protein